MVCQQCPIEVGIATYLTVLAVIVRNIIYRQAPLFWIIETNCAWHSQIRPKKYGNMTIYSWKFHVPGWPKVYWTLIMLVFAGAPIHNRNLEMRIYLIFLFYLAILYSLCRIEFSLCNAWTIHVLSSNSSIKSCHGATHHMVFLLCSFISPIIHGSFEFAPTSPAAWS